jgi:murein DD-endopeptidase MepM/ murein hydrolase activator NlpD
VIKRTSIKRNSHKFLVATLATIVVAMSADLPETIKPSILGRLNVGLDPNHVSDAQIKGLIEDSTNQDKKAPHSIAIKRYTIQKGDSFSRIWAKFGGTLDKANQALKKLKGIGGSAEVLRTGENISLLVSQKSGEIRGLRKKLSDGRVVLLRGTPDGELNSSVTSPTIVENERIAAGTIYSSFSKAASEQKIPYEVIDELVDLFGNRIDFRRDMQLGDSFSVIYKEKRTEKGALIETGPIIAASIENEGKLLAAIRHVSSAGQINYYNENGSISGEFFLRYPVQFTRISSVFTNKRLHPILGKHRPHNGVDFSAPAGTPVRSVANGTIAEMGFDRGRGNFVRIQHEGTYSTEYFHLSKFTPGLHRGKRIEKGMVIGGVGATGLATAPHLHFGLFDKGKYVDPLKAKLPTETQAGEGIAKGYLVATLETLKNQHEQVRVAANKSSPKA